MYQAFTGNSSLQRLDAGSFFGDMLHHMGKLARKEVKHLGKRVRRTFTYITVIYFTFFSILKFVIIHSYFILFI